MCELKQSRNKFWQEAALYRCSYKKMFWEYAAHLQENTHAEVLFQWSSKVTLLKSQLSMGIPLQICCIFPEHLFLRTPAEGYMTVQSYIWNLMLNKLHRASTTPCTKVLKYVATGAINTTICEALKFISYAHFILTCTFFSFDWVHVLTRAVFEQ